jgi:hypothetical protein
VVWAWDPEATNENCTNILAKDDGYFLEKNNNQPVIDKMISKSILEISNVKNQSKAWEAIFKYFNNKKGRGNKGYQKDETIFIKINLGCANWSTNRDFTRRKGSPGFAETSPQVIISVLKQLVSFAGVPQDKIIVADPISHIYADIFEMLRNFLMLSTATGL